jgi:hypothetical protein
MSPELEKVCVEMMRSGDYYVYCNETFEEGFKAASKHYEKKVEALVEVVKKYESMIQHIYDTCLCERFETYGFDYNEKHPKRKEQEKGSRVNTPCVYIEKELGFDWKYSEPEGSCDSWKELRLKALEGWESLLDE